MLVALGDGSLVGAIHGEGSPWVLALHGWQRSHADFDRVLGPNFDLGPEDPSAGAPIGALALDLPGFGSSADPDRGWGTARYAEEIAPALDRFNAPAVLLGHSFGGRVALQLAAMYPEHVRALLLTGVPMALPPGRVPVRPKFGYLVVRRARRLGLVGEARLEAARQRYGSVDYREARGVVRDVLVTTLKERYDEVVAALEMPVHLLWGALDTVVPLEVATTALAELTDGTLEVLPGVGHLVPTEAPAELRRALVALAP